VGETRSAGKSFDIPKSLIWEAYLKVSGNKGAAGIDGQSLTEFEQDLRNNLFKLWNRMSSGSYFPGPVKAVPIPKSNGGTRMLPLPTG
jgi:retron-type reverse transcriptase